MEENTLIAFPTLEKVLVDFAERAKNQYQALLADRDKVASGKLYNSITCHVQRDEAIFEVSLELEEYWKYIEEGIAPAGKYKNPGWKAYPFILNWIKIKPVIPKPMANGKLPSEKSLAFLITRSIKDKGIKPVPLLDEAVTDVLDVFKSDIINAFAADCGAMLTLLVKGV